MADKLEALAYQKLMMLLVNSSSARRAKLLAILPDSMAEDADQMLQKASDKVRARQEYSLGLINHSFKTVLQSVIDADNRAVERYLQPLNVEGPFRYIRHLLITYHNYFRWKKFSSLYRHSASDVELLILLQYLNSTESRRFHPDFYDIFPYAIDVMNALL
jgi:hypothetical protein